MTSESDEKPGTVEGDVWHYCEACGRRVPCGELQTVSIGHMVCDGCANDMYRETQQGVGE
jgi:hypothetical protein